ncbi:hypothetical protein [Actinacidiphila glaucinigra]|uniref:Integral membrane protein n=1 Tax=Actinacidiphila glaucinigra TaxID=235986 RepID=A0A239I1J1_9ACTN|nr:hypothetical protein [Actinacidiphila glaucinigra]SNS86234.1 hypothetical protein SAMN05216252_109164 [Actinacidiphila glaucinigra]
MSSPVRAGADLRLLRAAVFTAVCVVLSAGAHMLASGHGVPGWTLAAGWLAVFAFATPLAGRERSTPAIATGLAGGQLVLHVLFNLGGICGGGGVAEIAGRLLCDERVTELPSHVHTVAGTSHMAGMPGMAVMPGMSPAAAESTMLSYSLPMLLGHAVAAVTAGWLLRRGEAALWRLVALSVRGLAELSGGALRHAVALVRLLLTGSPATPCAVPGAGRTDGSAPVPRTVLLRHSLARRGPPAHALAA